jgi:hypothetical protein
MKKLEDISKKGIFKVPDGYFEKLPGLIQSRVNEESASRERNIFAHYKIAFAISSILIAFVGVFWYVTNTSQPTDAEGLLSSVPTEVLIGYLNESEISTEDILSDIDFSESDLDELENEVLQFHFEENPDIETVPERDSL